MQELEQHDIPRGFSKAPCDMIVYKGLSVFSTKNQFASPDYYLAQLVIPKGTRIFTECSLERRNSIHRKKLRAELAFVHCIIPATNSKNIVAPFSRKLTHKARFTPIATEYEAGDMIYPDKFSERHDQCGNGIHFYLNEKDAKTWLSW